MKYQTKPYIALQLTPIDSVHQVRAHYVTSTNLQGSKKQIVLLSGTSNNGGGQVDLS